MPTAAYIARYPEAYNNPNIVSLMTGLRNVFAADVVLVMVDYMAASICRSSRTEEQLDGVFLRFHQPSDTSHADLVIRLPHAGHLLSLRDPYTAQEGDRIPSNCIIIAILYA